jgi:hypothetical protein
MNDIYDRLRNDTVFGDPKCRSRCIVEDMAPRRGIDHTPTRETPLVLHGAGLVVTGPGDARSATRPMEARNKRCKGNLLQRAVRNPNPEVALT